MKPVLSTRGRKVLEKALAAMKRYPGTVDMGDWVDHNPRVKSTPRRPQPYCGTVACVAGHIVLAATGKQPEYPPEIPRSALIVLGVPTSEQERVENALFFISGWPLEFSDRYHTALTSRNRAAAVIARVRHWLKTGE